MIMGSNHWYSLQSQYIYHGVWVVRGKTDLWLTSVQQKDDTSPHGSFSGPWIWWLLLYTQRVSTEKQWVDRLLFLKKTKQKQGRDKILWKGYQILNFFLINKPTNEGQNTDNKKCNQTLSLLGYGGVRDINTPLTSTGCQCHWRVKLEGSGSNWAPLCVSPSPHWQWDTWPLGNTGTYH